MDLDRIDEILLDIKKISDEKGYVLNEEIEELVGEGFDPDDIIVRTTDLQNDHISLRVARSDHRGIISAAYMCLRTTAEVTRRYGYQLLRACELSKAIYGFGSGLRQSIHFDCIKRMPVVVPPLAEQLAVVRYVEQRLPAYSDKDGVNELFNQALKLMSARYVPSEAAIILRGIEAALRSTDGNK